MTSNALTKTTRSGKVFSPYSMHAKRVGLAAGAFTATQLAKQIVGYATKKAYNAVTGKKDSSARTQGGAGGSSGAGSFHGLVRTPKSGKRKIKSRKRVKRPLRFREGMTIKREGRGSVTDPNAVFIGQGPAASLIVDCFYGCIVRELFRQAGYAVESWAQPFVDMIGGGSSYPASSQYTIEYYYHGTPNSTTEGSSGYTIPSGTSTTIQQVVTGLADAVRASFGTTLVHEIIAFRFYNAKVSNGTTAVPMSLSYIKCDNMSFKVSSWQNMLLQNRTLAGLSASPDADADSRDNILANPLYATVYRVKGNTFIPKWRNASDLSYTGFSAGAVTGLIVTNATDSLPEQGVQPAKVLFNGTKVSRDRIEPGAIKQLKTSSTQQYSMKRFAEVFRTSLDNGTATDQVSYGQSHLIGYEKMLSVTPSTENPILVAYETNQTVKVDYRYNPTTRITPYVITTADNTA